MRVHCTGVIRTRCVRWSIVGVVAFVGVADAQRAAIDGTVVDESGLPVAGATILRGTESAVTDDAGAFSIAGSGSLTVIAPGFASQTVAASKDIVVRLERTSGEVIEISGKAPEESKPIAYTMSAKDIATTPGAMNDALRAITILPAAARIPFSFGGVVLRGMSPRDSSVFIDGVEIPLAFHFGGITGVFPTQVLDSMRVVPSGFDVSMGRTQGGVVELTSRKPRGDAYRIGGEVSLLHSQIDAEGPAPKGGAFLVSLRRSYLDVLIRPFLAAADPLPSYTDGQIRGVWGDAAKKGEIATYVIGSLDRIANSEDAAKPRDPESDEHVAANLGFVRAGAIYKRKQGASLLTLAPMVGTNILTLYSKSYEGPNRDELNELDLTRRWYLFGGRGEWLRDDPGGFVRVGADVSGGYLGRVDQATAVGDGDTDEIPFPRNTVLWTDAAIFIEARRHWLDDRVSIRPGLRLDRCGIGEQWAIAPRINAHLTLSPTATLRASVGRFHQPPSPAHFDEFVDNLQAKSSYVDQATLALEATPAEGVTASVVAFAHEGRKTLVDIADKNIRPSGIDLERVFAELLEEQLGLYAYQANVGRQRAYGIETSLRYDAADYRVLANFSWSRAKRVYETGGWVPYGLDQPMRLNLLFATTAWEWNIGTRLTVVSGNPVNIVPEGTPYDPSVEAPTQLVRLPTFWTIDLRIDRTWDRGWGNITLFFDIQNVTNHRNVEYRDSLVEFNFEPTGNEKYRYSDVLGLPIIPYIGVELRPH